MAGQEQAAIAEGRGGKQEVAQGACGPWCIDGSAELASEQARASQGSDEAWHGARKDAA